MNKKGFTLVEVLVSLALVSTIAIFLFQIIFIIRDVYAEKNIKSEIYIESSNLSNTINKDIFNKEKNNIYIKTINKVSNDEMYIVYSDGTKNNIIIDRFNHTITYGNYSVSILDVANIGNIELYYNYETTSTVKNGICYIKIPITHEDYKNDFGVVITYRYDSSKTRINGEISIIPGSEEDPTVPQTEICTTAIDTSWTFDYTGDVQNFEPPCSGTYKLEVWGAQGSSHGSAGGKGGYSVGTVLLSGNTILNVAVGEVGKNGSAAYNGGGVNSNGSGGNGGGGATHIALADTNNTYGTLASYGNATTAINYVYIVAGGGGGSGRDIGSVPGGYGGGLTGGSATSGAGTRGQGGTQTTGYGFGQGGVGSSTVGQPTQGGGGGWYGGTAGGSLGTYGTAGGGGGSAYLNTDLGLTDGETIAGNTSMPTHDGTSTMTGNSGNGYAKITFISAASNVVMVLPTTFEYTGSVQTFVAPISGTYKLEVWGAQGGSGSGYGGGKGGYSYGNVELTADDTIYVYVGGSGGSNCHGSSGGGGFNGGGNCSSSGNYYWTGAGGGATHIGKAEELLKNTPVSDLYIVAGGGGGGSYDSGTSSYSGGGGCGGGTNGCGASTSQGSASGGSQSAGGRGAGYGYGGSASSSIYAGGGGGYYGGGLSNHDNSPAGGGSGYIGGVTDGQTIAGNATMPTHDGTSTMTGNSGHGYAKITLINS